ncbi:MAG: hypothetical protein M3P18_10250 [Actinomycetota bacterium]|nr:hypothetical protein [Actinomycetota bacterium]
MNRRVPLEETLAALGRTIEFPPEPDVSRGVRARIREKVIPARSARPMGVRIAVAAIALIVAATGVLFFSPTARHALARWLGLPGIRIVITHRTPAIAPGRTLHLGQPATLARAQRRLGERVRVPLNDNLGAPDAVYVNDAAPVVWLVYRPAPELPPVAGHDVGLLVTELRAQVDDTFYKKLLAGGADLRPVSVGGRTGFWIHGQPHVIEYRDPAGFQTQEAGRVSGNSLIWSDGAITYRIEVAAGLRTAMAIARSMR